MTKDEITNKVSELLSEHENCGDPKHFLKITLDKIEFVHTAKTLNPKLSLIRIKAEDLKHGFTASQWNALADTITKIRLELER